MVIGTGNPKIPFFACPINRPLSKGDLECVLNVLYEHIVSDYALCKRQEDSEPRAVAKLSHLLAIQTIRTMGPVSANSGESESFHPPW